MSSGGVAVLHRDQGREMSSVICEEQRRRAALPAVALHWQVNATKGDGGQRLTIGITEDGVGHHDDGSLKDVGQDEHMELLQALVHHRVSR